MFRGLLFSTFVKNLRTQQKPIWQHNKSRNGRSRHFKGFTATISIIGLGWTYLIISIVALCSMWYQRLSSKDCRPFYSSFERIAGHFLAVLRYPQYPQVGGWGYRGYPKTALKLLFIAVCTCSSVRALHKSLLGNITNQEKEGVNISRILP